MLRQLVSGVREFVRTERVYRDAVISLEWVFRPLD